MLEKLRDLYAREPARINALLASVLVAGAGVVGVVLDAGTIAALVGSVLAVVLLGEKTRRGVYSPRSLDELTDVASDLPAGGWDEPATY